MEKRMVRVLLGLLALFFCASQALAVPAAPATLYMPPSPDVDGVYKIVWSPVSGCNYVLQESKNGAAFATIYSGSNTYIYPPKRALGTYAYQVKAVNSTGSSLWKAGATTVTVGATTAQTAAPTYLNVPSATSTSATKITFGGAALNATYVLEQAVGTSPTFTVVYTGSNGYYYTVGLVDGTTYAYRVKAKVAGYADSNYYPGTTGSTLAVTFPQGAAACVSCHNPATTDPSAPTAANALAVGPDWTAGRHANANQFPGPGVCDNCHNVNNVAGTTVAQITCQACHGTADHATDNITVAVASCANCHNSHVSAVNNIVTKVNGGKHAIGPNTHNSATCNKCHSVEGNVAFRAGLTVPANSPSGPSCVVCHDSHTVALRDPQYTLCTSCHQTSGFYHDGSWSRNIMSTHNDDATTGVTFDGVNDVPTGASNTIEGYVLRTGSTNPCLDCHGHEFLTETGNLSRVGFVGLDIDGVTPKTYYGYVKDTAHESTTHTDWAKSAHAGGLLAAKYATQEAYPKKNVVDGTGAILATGTYDFAAGMTTAVKAVGVTDSPVGNAWAHYNWDRSGRSSCQHCHTATGAANFMDAARNGTAYVAANNNFSHLAGWTDNPTIGSVQNEVLYCWGCHTSVETGGLRLTGAFKLDYLVNGAAMQLTAPDGKSGACLTCHSGRGNLNTLLGANPLDPTNTTAISNPGTKTHYLAAGMSLYQAQLKTPYTYGLSYADPVYYGHDNLGCAECHMTSTNKHSFGVVGKDAITGAVTSVASQKCVECHDGEHGAALVAASQVGKTLNLWNGTAAVPTVVTTQMVTDAALLLEEEAEGYHEAIAILGGLLTTAGTPPQLAYPYFSGTPTDQGQIGAMYNYSFLHHEPGAYAHNRFMAKRMLFDSIDWMDNRTLDGSITIDDVAYPEAGLWFGAVAGVATRP